MPTSPLLAAIRKSTNGVTLLELLARFPDVSRRSAQRWIGLWLASGLIRTAGNARARRYFAANRGATTPSGRQKFQDFIPLSPESLEIVAYLDQRIEARKPVGYQLEFLEAYQPNKSWYLPASLRHRLHRIGRTGEAGDAAGTYSRAILNRLLIDLSWASSNLEGNTYSRLDTRRLIEHGKAARGKDAIETQMILNHKSAIEMLVENIDTARFNRYTIMNLHSALAENLLPNPADEGRVRQHAVDIGKSVYRPLSAPKQIDAMLDVLLDKADRITDPFEQSFFIMVHLPYLQPFADINKRTSRLAANLPLSRANLCPLTFLDVPENAYSRGILGVYELTRIELLRDVFAWGYERSAQEYLAIKQELAQPDPLRLAYRETIKQAVCAVVKNHQRKASTLIERALSDVVESEREQVRMLISDELARLHEGVLARYGLRPSEFKAWKTP
ncbi:MAG: Fic family protein [Burkholderiales bacterium]